MKSARPTKTSAGNQSSELRVPSSEYGVHNYPETARNPQPATRNSEPGTRFPTTPLNGSDLQNGAGDGLPSATVGGIPITQRPPTPEEAAQAFHARRRLLMWAGLLLLLTILVIEVVALSPWTDPATGSAPRQIVSVPLAEVNPFGVNVFLHKEVDRWKRERTLDMARDMGVVWIKQQFPWAEIEFRQDPNRPYWDVKNDQSAWDKFDDIVSLAEERGLRIIARIDSAPEWARYDESMDPGVREVLKSNPKYPPSPGHLDDFGLFVEEFVKRYKGRIAAIQVWNEPNLKEEWPSGVNANEYVKLLQRANLSAKSVDPNIIILAAPLATNNERLELNGNLNELDYLQAMYYAEARPYFDAMSANAYGKEFPPEDPPSRDKLNFRRVELLRRVMEDNGDFAKAIWFNEYGWNASPEGCCVARTPGGEPYPWGRVSLKEQADYTRRGIEYAREHWPWAGVFTIWYLRQVGDIPANSSEFYFGLVNEQFVAGPAYTGVQGVARAEQVATPGEWSALSMAVRPGPGWEVQLSPAVPGGAYVAPAPYAAEHGADLDLTFQGTDVTLRLVPPSGSANTVSARYYVTVDGSSSEVSASLPRDGEGRAYIDLPFGGQASEAQVVRNLGVEFRTGQHRLRISAAPTEPVGDPTGAGGGGVASPDIQPEAPNLPGIATIRVEANRSYLLFTLLTGLLLAGIGIEVWALRQSRPQPVLQAAKG